MFNANSLRSGDFSANSNRFREGEFSLCYSSNWQFAATWFSDGHRLDFSFKILTLTCGIQTAEELLRLGCCSPDGPLQSGSAGPSTKSQLPQRQQAAETRARAVADEVVFFFPRHIPYLLPSECFDYCKWLTESDWFWCGFVCLFSEHLTAVCVEIKDGEGHQGDLGIWRLRECFIWSKWLMPGFGVFNKLKGGER